MYVRILRMESGSIGVQLVAALPPAVTGPKIPFHF